MAIVLHHLAAGRHRPQRHGRFVDLRNRFVLARGGGREERKRLVAQRLDRPERFAPRQAQRRPEGVGLGELDKRGRRHAGAAPEIVDRGEGPVGAGGDDRRGMGVGEAFHHAHAEPHREAALVIRRLQRAVPARGVDADGAHLDAMRLGVAHDLRGRVEAHRLRVQQRGAEDVRMPALHPGRWHRRSAQTRLRGFPEIRNCRSPQAA